LQLSARCMMNLEFGYNKTENENVSAMAEFVCTVPRKGGL